MCIKNLHVSGPVPFQPPLLKGQLYLGEVGREREVVLKKQQNWNQLPFPEITKLLELSKSQNLERGGAGKGIESGALRPVLSSF